MTDYVTSRADVEPVLRRFEEMISKYKFMEASLQRRVAGLDDKIPDIQKTADTVRFLKIRNDAEVSDPIETTFELNPTLYAKAEVKAKMEEVYLWLGANVMLSYPIEEAEELLEKRLSGARKSKGECEEDLDYLREQITVRAYCVTSLRMARLTLRCGRRWRSTSPGYTTGTSRRSARRKKQAETTRRHPKARRMRPDELRRCRRGMMLTLGAGKDEAS